MRTIGVSACVIISAAGITAAVAAESKPRAKPEFQYASGDIKIPIPTADEPRVAAFGPDTIRAAARYVDDGAVAWSRERTCVACHTTGPYMLARPRLAAVLGRPADEVAAGFVKAIRPEPAAAKTNGDVTFHPQGERAVWVAAGLAQWDRHVTKRLSPDTDRAIRSMLAHQASHGGFHQGTAEVEIPHVTTDFELTTHAARAIVDAPGWLQSVAGDAEIEGRIARLKDFLRTTPPRHDFDRALALDVAAVMPDLVDEAQRAAVIAMLWSKQRADGGWSTRAMSPVRQWREPMSDKVVALIEGLPDAADPGSDPYMTALAIVLLRNAGVPAGDPRIRRGIGWLKREQRESGRWWMHSLYRGNYHFTTYLATAKALEALMLCGEIGASAAPATSAAPAGAATATAEASAASSPPAAKGPAVRVSGIRRAFHNGEHDAFTDLCRFGDRIYLAFRSCPDGHMVHPTSRVIVLASDDEGATWREAHSFSVPLRDVRDPHFLVFKGRLFVYTGTWYSGPKTIPTSDYDLNKHLGYAVWTDDGASWHGPTMLEGTFGHYIWRAAAHGERAYLCGRRKPQFEVDARGEGPEVESLVLESDDGLVWRTRGVFQADRGDETAFLFEADGRGLAIARDGKGEAAGLLVSRPPYSAWERTPLGQSVGGPLLAVWRGRHVVGGRKTTADRGPKTSLAWLDGATLDEFAELPSGGDCSYPGLVELRDGRALVSWYSSHEQDATGKPITAIYLAELELAAP